MLVPWRVFSPSKQNLHLHLATSDFPWVSLDSFRFREFILHTKKREDSFGSSVQGLLAYLLLIVRLSCLALNISWKVELFLFFWRHFFIGASLVEFKMDPLNA